MPPTNIHINAQNFVTVDVPEGVPLDRGYAGFCRWQRLPGTKTWGYYRAIGNAPDYLLSRALFNDNMELLMDSIDGCHDLGLNTNRWPTNQGFPAQLSNLGRQYHP